MVDEQDNVENVAECPVCGAIIPVDAKVCPECGAVFEDEDNEMGYKMDANPIQSANQTNENDKTDYNSSEELDYNPKKTIHEKINDFLFGKKIYNPKSDSSKLEKILSTPRNVDTYPDTVAAVYVPKKVHSKISEDDREKFHLIKSDYIGIALKEFDGEYTIDKEKLDDFVEKTGADLEKVDNTYILKWDAHRFSNGKAAMVAAGLVSLLVGAANAYNGTFDASSAKGVLDSLLTYKEPVVQHVAGVIPPTSVNGTESGNIHFVNYDSPYNGTFNGTTDGSTFNGTINYVKRLPAWIAEVGVGLITALRGGSYEKNKSPLTYISNVIDNLSDFYKREESTDNSGIDVESLGD